MRVHRNHSPRTPGHRASPGMAINPIPIAQRTPNQMDARHSAQGGAGSDLRARMTIANGPSPIAIDSKVNERTQCSELTSTATEVGLWRTIKRDPWASPNKAVPPWNWATRPTRNQEAAHTWADITRARRDAECDSLGVRRFRKSETAVKPNNMAGMLHRISSVIRTRRFQCRFSPHLGCSPSQGCTR